MMLRKPKLGLFGSTQERPTVAELKVKRLSDYDDVVRDHLKTIGTYKTDLTFWRACGKLLEGKVARTAAK